MTRQYALKRLLEHGPMTAYDIVDCTKWAQSYTFRLLDRLIESGDVKRINAWHGYLFEAV